MQPPLPMVAIIGLAILTGASWPLVASACAIESPGDGVYRFAWISDAQEPGERVPLRNAISTISSHHAALLVYGGDTSYGHGDAPADWLRAIGAYNDPARLLFVYGNHDAGAGYRRFVPAPDGQAWWEKRVGDAVIVAIDTNVPLTRDSPQMKWLESTLWRYRDDVVILVAHKPWWVPSPYHSGADTFNGDAGHLRYLASTYRVDLVLAGHEHYYARMKLDGITYIVTGPVDARLRPVPAEVSRVASYTASERTVLLVDASANGVSVRVLGPTDNQLEKFDVGTPASAGPGRGSGTTGPGGGTGSASGGSGSGGGTGPQTPTDRGTRDVGYKNPSPSEPASYIFTAPFIFGCLAGGALALLPRRLPFLSIPSVDQAHW